jgi:hypothetical protein
MDNQMIIDALADPAVVERDVSRREALRSSGLLGLGLAAVTMPFALAATSRKAFGQGAALPNQIVNALNVALILERLEAEFYKQGLETSGLIPSEDRAIFEQIGKHEEAHVAFLEGALGARATRVPRSAFDYTVGGTFDTFGDYPTFQLVAQGFEDFGVRAYKGQAANLAANDAILTAALQIHSVEARHASEIRRLRGEKGWISGGVPAGFPLAAVYAGEDNVTQAGIDLSTIEGAAAATEAFDEPVTDLRTVLTVVSTFVRKS